MDRTDDLRRFAARCTRALGFAVQALAAARQRALLAWVGMAIGVCAVVALAALGKSVERQALSEFDQLGTQVVTVSLMQDTADPAASPGAAGPLASHAARRSGTDVMSALFAAPEIEAATELMSVPCQPDGTPSAAQASRPAEMTAVRPQLQDILRIKLETGRFLHRLDKAEPWVVLGWEVAKRMRTAGKRTEPGATLMVCGKALQVAGVMLPMSMSESTVQLSLDHAMLVSVHTAARLGRMPEPGRFVMRLRDGVSPTDHAPRLETLVHAATGKAVLVDTAQKIIDLRRDQTEMFTRYLVALSAVSVLIGGLGILNVMLMSVLERRREIGLRLALGADDIDIALQFLFESLLIALAGGTAGIVLGIAAAAGVAALAQLPFVAPLSALGTGLLLSLLVGSGSGLYPAVKAARMEPVATLQSPG